MNELSALLRKLDSLSDTTETLQLLVTIDEVQALLKQQSSNPTPKPTARTTSDAAPSHGIPRDAAEAECNQDRYSHLLRAINYIRDQPIFFVLLSTHPRMSALAPSREMADSARYIENVPRLPSPFTETPFDCHKNIDGSTFTFDMLSDIAHLSQYGRPL